MSLDASLNLLFLSLRVIFQSPLAWAAALITCFGVALALLGAFARFGSKSNTEGR